MNERLKEIAIKAQVEHCVSHVRLQEFAELIIKECAEVCNKVYFDNYPDAEEWERSQEGDAIKQHFGVKR